MDQYFSFRHVCIVIHSGRHVIAQYLENYCIACVEYNEADNVRCELDLHVRLLLRSVLCYYCISRDPALCCSGSHKKVHRFSEKFEPGRFFPTGDSLICVIARLCDCAIACCVHCENLDDFFLQGIL